MRVQDLQLVPFTIAPARLAVVRKPWANSRFIFDLLASASLVLLLVPTFLYLDIGLAVAVPLAVLIGLTSQHLFRLMFSPDRSDVFFPTTLVVGYFVIDFGARSFYLSTVPFFARIGRNPYDDYISAALWCASAGYVAFSLGMRSGVAKRWRRRLPVVTHQ